MRWFREYMRDNGQVSDAGLADRALCLVAGATVADVGAGGGEHAARLREIWPGTEAGRSGSTRPARLIGLDRSAALLAKAQRAAVFDATMTCDATELDLPDGAVDTVLCLETAEHLLAPQVPLLLAELARVARQQIVLTTPVPAELVKLDEVRAERDLARADPDPVGYQEYLSLAGGLHKSCLGPEWMTALGFRHDGCRSAGSLVYQADPAALRADPLATPPGIPLPAYPADDGRANWNGAYLELLDQVIEFGIHLNGLSREGG